MGRIVENPGTWKLISEPWFKDTLATDSVVMLIEK